MSLTEWLMVFLGIKLMAAVIGVLWSLHRDNNGRANVCAAIAVIYLFLFVWTQHRAEKEHELKHAIEQSAVQEQVEAVQKF